MIGGIRTPWKLARHGIPKAGSRMKPSAAHRKWIAEQPCMVKGVGCFSVIQAHHVRIGTDGFKGGKPSDCYCVPVCFTHHGEAHRGERSFEHAHKLDLKERALAYARRSPCRRTREFAASV